MKLYLMRSIFVSHWSIIPTMMLIHQIIMKILSKITRPWNKGHVDLYLFLGQSLDHTVSLPENMTPPRLCWEVYSFRLSVLPFVHVCSFVRSWFRPVLELLQSSTSEFLKLAYLTNHSSESILIWTIGTLEGGLHFGTPDSRVLAPEWS